MLNWLAVAGGGALGASLRYGLAQLLGGVMNYPLATQLANVLGSFCIGLLFVWIGGRYGQDHPAYQLLVVGLLGGFTTYSSFSLDALRLLEAGRWQAALIYVLSTVALCLLAAAAGLTLARQA